MYSSTITTIPPPSPPPPPHHPASQVKKPHYITEHQKIAPATHVILPSNDSLNPHTSTGSISHLHFLLMIPPPTYRPTHPSSISIVIAIVITHCPQPSFPLPPFLSLSPSLILSLSLSLSLSLLHPFTQRLTHAFAPTIACRARAYHTTMITALLMPKATFFKKRNCYCIFPVPRSKQKNNFGGKKYACNGGRFQKKKGRGGGGGGGGGPFSYHTSPRVHNNPQN